MTGNMPDPEGGVLGITSLSFPSAPMRFGARKGMVVIDTFVCLR
jgi:hypothetical protein